MNNNILKGKLVRWNDKKGFGFIKQEPGKRDLFIHITSLKNIPRKPIIGDTVFYQIHIDNNGKQRAVNSKIEGLKVSNKKYKTKQINVSRKTKNTSKISKLIFLVLILGFISSYIFSFLSKGSNNVTALIVEPQFIKGSTQHTQVITDAYNNRLSDVQVNGLGIVSRILRDDNEGSRHQKFILRLLSGQTLLIAHNIDLAQKIEILQAGDNVEFFGEYEWNSKGGVVHRTHKDPSGHHMDGWLKHGGQTYE